MTTTTARPRLADCECGCTFWFGSHDDLADKAGALAETLYDDAVALSLDGDTPDSLAAWDASEAADAEAVRLLDVDGVVLKCPRCAAEVVVD